MIKRIFDILTFPFYLIYLFVSFPFKIAKIIIDDKIEKRKYKDTKLSSNTNDEELIDIGTIIFSEFSNDYKTFIKSYLKDKKNISH